MNSNAYTKNTFEDLEELRELSRQPMIQRQTEMRIAAQSAAVTVMLDNLRARLWEVSDLMDEASGSGGDDVGFKALLDVLRAAEVNLDAAVGRLAGELGMTEAPTARH